MTSPRIPDNTRVKLKDGISPDFYDGFGLPGNEGWIRQHKAVDRYGPHQVFIQWDHDHWSYNGAQDRWTWEDHFDIVEGTPMNETKQDQIRALVGAFGDSLIEIAAGDPEPPADVQVPEAPKPTGSKDEEPSYDEVLDAATKTASDAEAFFVLAIRKEVNEETQEGLIYPVAYHASQNTRASLLAQMQLSKLAASFQERLVMQTMQSEDVE